MLAEVPREVGTSKDVRSFGFALKQVFSCSRNANEFACGKTSLSDYVYEK